MRRRLFMYCLFWSFCIFHSKAQIIGPQVNENVELMSILARLAGYPEYNMDMAGQYITDIDLHFKNTFEHPAVIYMKDLRKQHGISYDAVMSMALHVKEKEGKFFLIEEEINMLREQWDKVDKNKFLNLLADFYKESHFHDFFKAHQEFYQKGIQAYEDKVSKYIDENWFESFYGNVLNEKFSIIIGFCNGGANYGVSRHIKGEQKEVFALVAYFVNNNENKPLYVKEDLLTLVHEFNHSFINYLLDESRYPNHVKALESSGSYLLESSMWAMSQQAYGEWKSMISESLVRAAVICYMLDKNYKPEEVRKELLYNMQRNFRWMPELVGLLRKYERKQKKYGNFENFYPQIIDFFVNYAEKENKKLSIVK